LGDCREIVPTLGRFDLLLTDPPYGAGYAANPVVGKGKARSNHVDSDWDNEAPELSFGAETIMHCRCDVVGLHGLRETPLRHCQTWNLRGHRSTQTPVFSIGPLPQQMRNASDTPRKNRYP
jgi:hypothetical protein